MSNVAKYRIEKVADFLELPPERLAVFLAEFAASAEKLRGEVRRTGRCLSAITWEDDGAQNVKFRYVP